MAPKAKPKDPVTPQKSEAKQQDELVKEFCALVDESLIVLLFQEQGLEEARRQLLVLAQNVREEEASGFDPSGLPGSWVEEPETPKDGSPATPARNANTDHSSSAGLSDYGSGAASQSTPASDAFDDWRSMAYELPSSGSTATTPEGTLKEAFPMLKEIDIKTALKESGGDIDKASDILLNYGHLEETGDRKKGVDGFFVPDGQPARRPKGKKKRSALASFDDNTKKGGRTALAVEYKLTPLKLEEDNEGSSVGGKAVGGATAVATVRNGNLVGPEEKKAAAAQVREGSRATFEMASKAYRRGRSDPLFRSVAAVYSERGRDQAHQARIAESEAADAVVDSQSAHDYVDLHYVPVHDGVRNALERTQNWWSGLGENRVRKARESPLRVVTGIGRNSERGYSRMYGEVGPALEREGWKVKPGQGYYLVTGKK